MRGYLNLKKQDKIKLILKHLKTPKTINDVIEIIFKNHVNSNKALSYGPWFYTHLNKLPSVMEKMNLIKKKSRDGGINKNEIIWEKI